MTNKKDGKKNLISTHGWLGISISVVLFLIFWAGAISLFKSEIQQWAEMPHYPIDSSASDKSLVTIMDEKIKQHPFDHQQHLMVILPSQQSPYYAFMIDLIQTEDEPRKGSGKGQVVRIKVNPKTGETIGSYNQLPWAGFMLRLHYNLNLKRIGSYLIGIVTLFLLFALFSGIVIHANKLVARFFTYRKNKQRTQLLDLHNVVGVMSLPFTLMYAITGLMFNLAVVYQIAFVMGLYEGDRQALLADVGFAPFVAQQQTGVKQDMSAVLPLIEQANKEYGPASRLVFHNYADETAVLQVIGQQRDNFAQRYELYFKVQDGSIIRQYNAEQLNFFRKGREVLASLHFGNYAGADLRILYFVLALAVAGMILAGNLLWINKRKQQSSQNQSAVLLLGNLTVGACCGLVLASALGFFVERTMPLDIELRAQLSALIFISTTFFLTVLAYFFSNKKLFIAQTLYATSAVLLLTVLTDWLMFAEVLVELYKAGFTAPIAVEVGLTLFSVMSWFSARRLMQQRKF